MSSKLRHDFDKLNRLPPYSLGEVIALMRAGRRAGEDIVDLGMGNPDLPTPPHVVAKIAEGNHPDSDPAFWDGWEDDVARPAFPGEAAAASPLRTAAVVLAIAALVVLLARRRRATPTA